jgi:DNA-binding beta-propeller fold protein YncE
MPPLSDPADVYAADRSGALSSAVSHDPAYVYVPDTKTGDVSVIDQHSLRVVRHFSAGAEPQHVVPSYDLRTLYATADVPGHGSITAIDPGTGLPGRALPIDDAYNLYFTPDGRYAVVVQPAYHRLAFFDRRTWKAHDYLSLPDCVGINHLDYTADGNEMVASCQYTNDLAVISVSGHRLLRMVHLTQVDGGMPQDVRLSPNGRYFFVADGVANGVYLVDAHSLRVVRFQPTGEGAHGLIVSRDARSIFVTNRSEGSISVLDANTGRPVTKWRLPHGGSPDEGNLSADGSVLWLSGRFNSAVYAIDAHSGRMIRKIKVGSGPHGLLVWPQPGRYSLGNTGILR